MDIKLIKGHATSEWGAVDALPSKMLVQTAANFEGTLRDMRDLLSVNPLMTAVVVDADPIMDIDFCLLEEGYGFIASSVVIEVHRTYWRLVLEDKYTMDTVEYVTEE